MSTAELQQMVTQLVKSQKETDRQMKETHRRLGELGTLFTNQWGKLVEALLRSGLQKLFRARGIAVSEVSRNLELFDPATGHKKAEIDVFLQNGGEDVAVEVKTTCRVADVKDHMARLKLMRSLVKDYSQGKKLYGGIAALQYDSEADVFAEKQGMYVLRSTEGVVTITNAGDFVPKAW